MRCGERRERPGKKSSTALWQTEREALSPKAGGAQAEYETMLKLGGKKERAERAQKLAAHGRMGKSDQVSRHTEEKETKTGERKGKIAALR